MEARDRNTQLNEIAEAIFRKKKARQRELAKLSFEEKIKILVRLQHLASAVSQELRGHSRKPWPLQD
jgi:hypothetical protein